MKNTKQLKAAEAETRRKHSEICANLYKVRQSHPNGPKVRKLRLKMASTFDALQKARVELLEAMKGGTK